jgi:hypothetical protein
LTTSERRSSVGVSRRASISDLQLALEIDDLVRALDLALTRDHVAEAVGKCIGPALHIGAFGFRKAQLLADHLHRQTDAELRHEVAFALFDEAVDQLGHLVADARFQRIHARHRESEVHQLAEAGVDRRIGGQQRVHLRPAPGQNAADFRIFGQRARKHAAEVVREIVRAPCRFGAHVVAHHDLHARLWQFDHRCVGMCPLIERERVLHDFGIEKALGHFIHRSSRRLAAFCSVWIWHRQVGRTTRENAQVGLPYGARDQE